MFFILLKFSDKKDQAGRLMDGHNAWIQRGFDDDVFLLAGSIQPQMGGAILAHNTSRADLENRINQDPFVLESVVSAEIIEMAPSRTDERLRFLLG